MAQVRFYGMELNFEFIRMNYPKKGFGQLILQPYMADAEKWRDEFTLLIYALDYTGVVMDKANLKIDKYYKYKAQDRVELGNIPFPKTLLDEFIKEDGVTPGKIKSLYFMPEKYGEYVAYIVTAIAKDEKIKILAQGDLKPSPPAIPPTLLPAK